MQYTPEQQQIINHPISKHALVSAVAGSGKTQTLIARIKYLLEQNILPEKILVVMYNKSAREDFFLRVSKNISTEVAQRLNIRTFHSLGMYFLKQYQKNRFIPISELIKDEFKLKYYIKQAIQKAFLIIKDGRKKVSDELVENCKSYLSLIKTEVTPIEKNKMVSKLPKTTRNLVKEFFKQFEIIRIQNNFITYDDLLYLPCKFLAENPMYTENMKKIFSHIIIDEYQDINEVQQFLLKCLVGSNTYTMAVGDVDQTIYEWRGSNPYYMLQGFIQDFKNVDVYTLSYTFRYGNLISLMANQVITNNINRHDNLCVTYPKLDKKTDVEIHPLSYTTEIILKIKELLKNNVSSKEIAILVRKYNSTTLLELNCLVHNLPYAVVGSQGIFDILSFKAIYGYLMLYYKAKGFELHTKEEKQSFIRSMLLFPSIYLTKEMLDYLSEAISENISNADKILISFANSDKVRNEFQKKNIIKTAKLWKKFFDSKKSSKAKAILDEIINTLDLIEYIQNRKNEDYVKLSEIEILNNMKDFANINKKDLNEFTLQLYQLYQESLKSKDINSLSAEKIKIMSMHRAKGLEWDYVVLYDITESSFFGKKIINIDELEAERRLFYVAMTRVKKQLIIVGGEDMKILNHWFNSKKNGSPEHISNESSLRFLFETKLNKCLEFNKELESKNITIDDKLFKKYLAKAKP